MNIITPRDIFGTKSSNSGNINTKDNTWQDSNTRVACRTSLREAAPTALLCYHGRHRH
ncbi:MAG: hypothetical protein HWQ41_24445 [Nostoc sp. NOS(2021)]|uniref:hypothetical protein n=1 Tax=Nostoc sp. NOS(2021) TaxID=2815407 RepID=UPI0025DC1744|nr:hypothetical protein [Nostoc sp. NOS(2021)]MBN3898307.1 hypothetical protein [Nostoc sp. NOS(2021)]